MFPTALRDDDRSSTLGRRAFLRQMGSSIGALGMAGYLASDAFGAPAFQPHFAPRARHMVVLFMSGGPSHIDTFDPKPRIKEFEGQRPAEVQLRTERTTGGLYPSPFEFRPGGSSGLMVSDLLPHVRDCIDDICVVRSMHTISPNHQPAINFFSSGRIDATHPTLGAWVSYGLGTENRNLPGFVALGGGDRRLFRNGYLPGEHQGTLVSTRSFEPEKMIEHLKNRRLTDAQQLQQLEYLRALNDSHLDARGPTRFWKRGCGRWKLRFACSLPRPTCSTCDARPKRLVPRTARRPLATRAFWRAA